MPPDKHTHWTTILAVVVPTVALFLTVLFEVARTQNRVEQLEKIQAEMRIEVRRLQDDIKALLKE